MRNGFIVQSNEYTVHHQNEYYKGISIRRSWPITDHSMEELLDDIWSINYLDWYNRYEKKSLDALDENMLKKYLDECHKQGIIVRILYVDICQINETNSFSIPESIVKNNPNLIEMGYDLMYSGSSDNYYSAVNDEEWLLIEGRFMDKLNSYGLFSNIEDLEEYIQFRKVNETNNAIEPITDFVKAKIWLLKDFI